MGTSLTTPNLNLRYPSGAVGEPPDVPDDIRKLASDVEDRFGRTATNPGNLAAGTRYGQRAVVGLVEYRWNGSAWLPWESDWADYNPDTQQAQFNVQICQWRWRSGRVLVLVQASITATGTGTFWLAVPKTAAAKAIPLGNARVTGSDASVFELTPHFVNTGYVQMMTLGQTNPGKSYGANSNTWGVNAVFKTSFEYDAA